MFWWWEGSTVFTFGEGMSYPLHLLTTYCPFLGSIPPIKRQNGTQGHNPFHQKSSNTAVFCTYPYPKNCHSNGHYANCSQYNVASSNRPRKIRHYCVSVENNLSWVHLVQGVTVTCPHMRQWLHEFIGTFLGQQDGFYMHSFTSFSAILSVPHTGVEVIFVGTLACSPSSVVNLSFWSFVFLS